MQTQAENGQLEEARATIDDAIKVIAASSAAEHSLCISLLQDLAECKDAFSSRSAYESHGSKTITSTSMCYAMERSCGSKAAYKTKKKMAMMRKYGKF